MKFETASDIIRHIAKRENKKHKDIALHIGLTESNFSMKLVNNRFTAQELIDIIEFLGYKVFFGKDDKANIVQEVRKGVGDRLKAMIGGIMYDTEKSDAVCHAEFIKGMKIELYRDAQGRFFVAEYANWGSGKHNISPICKKDAYRLYKEYGDGTCDYMFN